MAGVLPPPAAPAPDLVLVVKVIFFGLLFVALYENYSEIIVTRFVQGYSVFEVSIHPYGTLSNLTACTCSRLA